VGGEQLDELEVAVQVLPAVVGPQGLDVHARHGLGAGDQAVGEPAVGQCDDQVVDRTVGSALHDVQAQDVGAGLAERGRERAEHAWPVRQDDAQQVRHDSSPFPWLPPVSVLAVSAMFPSHDPP